LDFANRSVSPQSLIDQIGAQRVSPAKPSSLTIRNAHITGGFDLSEWDLPFILRFIDCSFLGDVDFARYRTTASLLFRHCDFQGQAIFSEVHIERDFSAENCHFNGTKRTMALSDNEPTTFVHGRIGDDFSVNGSQFKGVLNLKHLNVGRDLYLQDTTYQGAEPDPDGDPGQVYLVPLAGTQIGHFLRIDHVLDINPATRIQVADCTFAGIFAQTNVKSTEEKEELFMLKMLEDLEYRAGSYDLIEHEFIRRGRPDLADDVYMHGKDRETAGARGFAKVKNLVLKYVAGYGRQPALAFTWCFAAVLIGAFVFVRDEGGKRDGRRYLRSFWYSLDLFVPVISVSGRDPEPPKSPFARSYVRIHRLLGWLLLPIALAAITGIVGKV